MRTSVRIFFLIIFFFNCGKNNECTRILPNRGVVIEINLNLPDGIELRNKGYKIYENQGIQGVIIYNYSGGWKAYDLASPHLDYKDKCSKMVVENGWFLKNTCDGALFLMETGAPHNDKSSCPLKEYFVVGGSNSNDVIMVRN